MPSVRGAAAPRGSGKDGFFTPAGPEIRFFCPSPFAVEKKCGILAVFRRPTGVRIEMYAKRGGDRHDRAGTGPPHHRGGRRADGRALLPAHAGGRGRRALQGGKPPAHLRPRARGGAPEEEQRLRAGPSLPPLLRDLPPGAHGPFQGLPGDAHRRRPGGLLRRGGLAHARRGAAPLPRSPSRLLRHVRGDLRGRGRGGDRLRRPAL